MKKTVFYSWQSDLPNNTNRNLIEYALNDAAKQITSDESIDIEPVIDRDTQGVAGAPEIITTIFNKISTADIFVADISLVLKGKKRSSPNPNVLIELGYALKVLGPERIVLIFNESSGKKEALPFDLKTRRLLIYSATEKDTDRSGIRLSLSKDVKSALVSGFSHIKLVTPKVDILEAIKSNYPSKKIQLRQYLEELLKNIENVQPPMKRDGGTAEDLMSTLPKTVALELAFGKLTETVVLMNDMESAREIFQWFGKILTKYDPPTTGAGQTWNCDGDYFKFVGHEFFVIFISPFLKEEKWEELHEILDHELKVGPTKYNPDDHKANWTKLAEFSPLLADESKKRKRLDLHADLLKDRHTTEPLAKILSWKDFLETDFFLYLHGSKDKNGYFSPDWYPRSVLWLDSVPRFITEAQDYPTAMKICRALDARDVEELKQRLNDATVLKFEWSNPIHRGNYIQKIGSVGGAEIIK